MHARTAYDLPHLEKNTPTSVINTEMFVPSELVHEITDVK